jgi:hypothetical protein
VSNNPNNFLPLSSVTVGPLVSRSGVRSLHRKVPVGLGKGHSLLAAEAKSAHRPPNIAENRGNGTVISEAVAVNHGVRDVVDDTTTEPNRGRENASGFDPDVGTAAAKWRRPALCENAPEGSLSRARLIYVGGFAACIEYQRSGKDRDKGETQ